VLHFRHCAIADLCEFKLWYQPRHCKVDCIHTGSSISVEFVYLV